MSPAPFISEAAICVSATVPLMRKVSVSSAYFVRKVLPTNRGNEQRSDANYTISFCIRDAFCWEILILR